MKLKLARVVPPLLGLVLFAFAAAGVNYVNLIFNTATRWLLLAILIVLLLPRLRVLAGLRGATGMFAIGFLVLAIVSTQWSDVPQLSLSKSLAYAAVAFALSAAGAYVATNADGQSALRVLWPLVVLVLTAVAGGTGQAGATLQMNESVGLYRGLANNPNFLGILIMCCLPALLWEMHLRRHRRWSRILQLVLCGLVLLALLSTYSRASFLGVSVLLGFYILGKGLKRQAAFLAIVIGAASFFAVAFPSQLQDLETRYVRKGVEAGAVFSSRQGAWTESLDGAVQGGLFGLGFGVSAGYTDYQVGLSSSSYGREKGNVSLAMVEEVGLLGFILFMGMITSLFVHLAKAMLSARSQHDRLLLSVVIGSLASLVLNAQFESWLISPGAAATPVFWMLLGLGLTVSRRVLSDERASTAGAWQGSGLEPSAMPRK